MRTSTKATGKHCVVNIATMIKVLPYLCLNGFPPPHFFLKISDPPILSPIPSPPIYNERSPILWIELCTFCTANPRGFGSSKDSISIVANISWGLSYFCSTKEFQFLCEVARCVFLCLSDPRARLIYQSEPNLNAIQCSKIPMLSQPEKILERALTDLPTLAHFV